MKLLKQYWISSLLTLVILVLCFMNVSKIVDQPPMTNFDKFAHFSMFLALSGAIFFDNTRYLRRKISYQRLLWGSFFIPIVLSGMIEIVQEQIPYRSGDWLDFLFDLLGAFVGLAVCIKINSRLKEIN